MKKQKFPPGWNEKRVKEVIAHYEKQTEDEEFAEIEAAREAEDITPIHSRSRGLLSCPPRPDADRLTDRAGLDLEDLQQPQRGLGWLTFPLFPTLNGLERHVQQTLKLEAHWQKPPCGLDGRKAGGGWLFGRHHFAGEGAKFQQLAHNVIDRDKGRSNASLAVSDGRLFLRNNQYLYCIGKR